MKRRGQNVLSARPPEGVHGLGVAGGEQFRRQVGRPVRPEDYYGVHTTGTPEIAAVYAMGAWDGLRDPDAYPVIITLDVSGLEAAPDVDALSQAAFLLGDRSLRADYEGLSLDEAGDAWQDYEYDHLYVGADINSAVMEMATYSQGPVGAFEDEEDWERWVSTGEYTDAEASRLVDQRRYLEDFDLDRVVRVEAMRPWWNELLEEPYDEQSEAKLEAVEEAGYRAVTPEDVLNLSGLLDLKTVYEGSTDERSRVQYHGTSSWHLARAFPELELPPNPFPVEPYEEVDVQALKARLMR